MFKKFFLTISFLIVIFYQAPLFTPKIYAEESIFETTWAAIINFLFPSLTIVKTDATKQSQISSQDTKKKFTDYTVQDKDWSHRTLPQSLRQKLIGIWFNDVITKRNTGDSDKQDYPNSTISKAENDCPEIKITDIIYYFATQTDKKILYDRSQDTPIDYPSDLISQNDTSLGPNSCYENVYKNIQSIPQGYFQDKGDAALSSTQLNDQLRYIVPQKTQTEITSKNNDTIEDTEKLIENSKKQHLVTRFSIIPQKFKDQTDCSGESTDGTDNQDKETIITNEIVNTFKRSLQPQSWQGESTQKTTSKSKTTITNNDDIDCSQSGHGKGMSQYGAEGMAQSGKTYEEILTAYYGIGEAYGLNIDFGTVNSDVDKIIVRLVNTEDDLCDEIVNEYKDRFKFGPEENSYRTLILTVEDYLLGLDEINVNSHRVAHQALTIAARGYAYARTNNLQNSISNTSDDQVFTCKRLLNNLRTFNNQTEALNLTPGVILTKNGELFSSEYSECHGKASLSPPYFDGTYYERLANAPIKSQNGLCDTLTIVNN